MIRFRFRMEIDGEANILPMNYSYLFASWIYNELTYREAELSVWLKEHHYFSDYRRFKCFTFSRFFPEQFQIEGDRMKILSKNGNWYLSLTISESFAVMLQKTFIEKRFCIGDKTSRVNFIIRSIEILGQETFVEESAIFKTLSPICVAHNFPGRKSISYLSPDEKIYENIFYQNLIRKYNSVHKTYLPGTDTYKFQLLGRPKPMLWLIHTERDYPVKVKGYEFTFSFQANQKLLEFGYYSGFGCKNNFGFGCVQRLKI